MKKISDLIVDFKNAKLTADGHYTDNTKDSIGGLYRIYNETSIGGNEQEQIFNFRNKLLKLIYLEREMRLELYLKSKPKTSDMIIKAIAIAKTATILDTEEAMDIIFKINLGIDLNIVSNVSHEECNAIYYKVQIAHLSYSLLNSIFRDFSAEITKIERANGTLVTPPTLEKVMKTDVNGKPTDKQLGWKVKKGDKITFQATGKTVNGKVYELEKWTGIKDKTSPPPTSQEILIEDDLKFSVKFKEKK